MQELYVPTFLLRYLRTCTARLGCCHGNLVQVRIPEHGTVLQTLINELFHGLLPSIQMWVCYRMEFPFSVMDKLCR